MPKTRDEYNAYMREYMRNWQHRRRAQALELLGGKCVRCGAVDSLEIDHVVPGSADPRTRAGRGNMWTFSEKRFLAELAKCQLLCSGCHRKKTVECRETGGGSNKIPEEDYIHGTVRMYAYKKCRCDECREASRLYKKGLIKVDEPLAQWPRAA